MDSKLANKVAIVTASTNGIGFSIAQRLARDGCKVVISSRKEENVKKALEKLQSEKLECHGLVCHAGKADDRKKLISETVSKFGGIDFLVTNAAVNPHVGPILNIDESKWDKIFEVNVKSTFFIIKEAFPFMQNRKGASIVIISSIAGYYVPFSEISAYAISKTALLGLTKAMTKECAKSGIRINCVAPGAIKTSFSEVVWKDDKNLQNFLSDCALQRVGEADECAGIVSFLCSNDSSYITGETIIVAGGLPSRL